MNIISVQKQTIKVNTVVVVALYKRTVLLLLDLETYCHVHGQKLIRKICQDRKTEYSLVAVMDKT